MLSAIWSGLRGRGDAILSRGADATEGEIAHGTGELLSLVLRDLFSELCAASPGVEAKCGGCKLAISVLRLDRTSGLMLEATPTQCAQEAK